MIDLNSLQSHFLFVGCGSLWEEPNILTCAKIWDISRQIKEGESIPLVVAKHPQRYQQSYGNTASSFAFNSFNMPIVAEYLSLVPEEVKRQFNKVHPHHYSIYDPSEGRFLASKFQAMLDKNNILREYYQSMNLMEGVGTPYDAVLALNHVSQQGDTSLQNHMINDDSFSELIDYNSDSCKPGWAEFYRDCRKKIPMTMTLRGGR